MANYVEIPTYLEQPNQEFYNEDFNQSLRQLLSNDGWRMPSLTTAEVTALGAAIPVATQWYNTTLNKMQIMTAGGVETITSV
jgi:hypothetical protein